VKVETTSPHTDLSTAELQAELADVRRRLADALQVKDRFLAALGHEIRTPLNAIMGMAGLLVDTQLDAEQRDFARTIRVSGDCLLTLFNHILDYTRLESGGLPTERMPFSLVETVEEALEMVAPAARDKHLALTCQFAGDLPQQVIGDAGRVRQILVNYLGNAIKFTARGEVSVSVGALAQPDGTMEIQFSVRDTGIGLSAGQRERLFQAFSRTDDVGSRRFGGVGLGLAISRKLAQLMGGRVWAHSESGLGAEFSFSIIAAVSQHSATSPWQPGRRTALAGLQVWLVCDQDTQRRGLRELLHGWGVRVRDTASASDAQQWARGGEPCDVAIIDLQGAPASGAHLAKALRAHRKSTLPVLLLSYGVGIPQADAATDMTQALVKPVRCAALLGALTALREAAAVPAASGGVATGTPAPSPGNADPGMAQRLPLRILVAEDNPTNVKLIKIVLGGLGYRPDIAGNGLEVLAALRRQPYDLVLMDVRMPELDGIETTRCICQEWPAGRRPRIVALTAGAMPEEREACLEAGVDEFLTKPATRAELLKALERCRPVAQALPAQAGA
jgi:CheY-like chemotaxis protein